MTQHCKKCKKTVCTGKENSPKGVGYCNKCAKLGKLRKGKDGKMYMCKKNKLGHKYWAKVHSDRRVQTGGTQVPAALDQPVSSRRLIEPTQAAALNLALQLKQFLSRNKLNIITAESLTAGMIAKTLVDVPGEGAVIYGGYIVYDTDAKRQMINVVTEGVYSHKTAAQMARGALLNSRAMVALAVTGNAMPYPEHKNLMGEVFIGVAIRMKGRIIIETKKINTCENPNVKKTCDDWKNLSIGFPNIPSWQHTAMLADYVRQATVVEALWFTLQVLNHKITPNDQNLGEIGYQKYDSICKPSWVILERMEKGINKDNLSQDCDGSEDRSFSYNSIKRNKNEWGSEQPLWG